MARFDYAVEIGTTDVGKKMRRCKNHTLLSSLGKIHLHLKPQNIRLAKLGHVIIMNFDFTEAAHI